MLSSDQWIYIVDFAPYKPTFIDQSDPVKKICFFVVFFSYLCFCVCVNYKQAAFAFYFDSTTTRRCNVAPERFVSGASRPRNNAPTHAMDLFALGCLVFELYAATPLFSLATMAQYKRRLYDPMRLVNTRIASTDVRQLIATLISLDPVERRS